MPTSMQALAPAVTAASKHQKHGRDPESGADAQVEHEVRWLHGWDRAAAKSKKATILSIGTLPSKGVRADAEPASPEFKSSQVKSSQVKSSQV